MNLYNFFGLNADFSLKGLKKSFKKKVKFWHPDRSKYEKDFSERVFRFVKSSHDILANPELRKIYDSFYEEVMLHINANDDHKNS